MPAKVITNSYPHYSRNAGAGRGIFISPDTA